MIKRLAIPVLIIAGAILVFVGVFTGDGGPKGHFVLSESQIAWLMQRPRLVIEMDEAIARNHSEARDHCYASRTSTFSPSGTALVNQTCRDDDGREYFDEAAVTWRLNDAQLCMDFRPLDRDPACWLIRYRNGVFEFLNAAETAVWFSRVRSDDMPTLDDLFQGLSGQ